MLSWLLQRHDEQMNSSCGAAGFFVCKLKKVANAKKEAGDDDADDAQADAGEDGAEELSVDAGASPNPSPSTRATGAAAAAAANGGGAPMWAGKGLARTKAQPSPAVAEGAVHASQSCCWSLLCIVAISFYPMSATVHQ